MESDSCALDLCMMKWRDSMEFLLESHSIVEKSYRLSYSAKNPTSCFGYLVLQAHQWGHIINLSFLSLKNWERNAIVQPIVKSCALCDEGFLALQSFQTLDLAWKKPDILKRREECSWLILVNVRGNRNLHSGNDFQPLEIVASRVCSFPSLFSHFLSASFVNDKVNCFLYPQRAFIIILVKRQRTAVPLMSWESRCKKSWYHATNNHHLICTLYQLLMISELLRNDTELIKHASLQEKFNLFFHSIKQRELLFYGCTKVQIFIY